jgi:hypothetical protein
MPGRSASAFLARRAGFGRLNLSEKTEMSKRKTPFATVEEALEEIRQGRTIVLVDDEDRENEGDAAMAAGKITTFRQVRVGEEDKNPEPPQQDLPLASSFCRAVYGLTFRKGRSGMLRGIAR